MTEEQRQLSAEKKQHVKQQLQAQEVIRHFITYHWLGYYKEMLGLGMQVEIDHLAIVTEPELPYFTAALQALNEPLLKPEWIKTNGERIMDDFFDAFPSLSHFKYVIELPIISEYGGDPQEMLLKAQQVLNIKEGPVYFISNDTSPQLTLQWKELVAHATTLFDDGGLITLIITDPARKWVIFRSIEEEWRCGKWEA